MILLEDFRFALEVELEPNPAHPDNMTREAAEVAEAPGPAPRAAPGGGQEREFVSQKSAKKRGGHRLAAAVRNEDLRISTPEEDAARGGPAVVPKELARVKLRAVPNGARVMQAVASVFAEISKGVEQVQNFMAARHVVRVLVDVLRSADVAEG